MFKMVVMKFMAPRREEIWYWSFNIWPVPACRIRTI